MSSLLGCQAPLTVDRYDDEPSASACVEGVPNDCSLRGAILNTNRTPGPASIALPAGSYVLSVPGRNEDASETGDLDITDDLTIAGAPDAEGHRPNVVLADVYIDRTMHVDPARTGITVRLADLDLAGGLALDLEAPDWGGSPYGGTILNTGAALTLERCAILTGEAIVGAAILNEGRLTLVGSTVTGGYLFFLLKGGGIANGNPYTGAPGGQVSIEDSEVREFEVAHYDTWRPFGTEVIEGGGIYNGDGGVLTITRSTIAANRLSSGAILQPACVEPVLGGGIANHAALWIEQSTVAANGVSESCGFGLSSARGGGIANTAEAALVNVTLSGNAAYSSSQPGEGSALYNAGTAVLAHVTSAENLPAGGAAIHGAGGILELANSLIHDACGGAGILSSGGNLESPADTCGLDHPSDLPAVPDPGLGPLADNGGPTQTVALLTGSPALDAGLPAACLATDQRGEPREDGHCDIGAFERQPEDS